MHLYTALQRESDENSWRATSRSHSQGDDWLQGTYISALFDVIILFSFCAYEENSSSSATVSEAAYILRWIHAGWVDWVDFKLKKLQQKSPPPIDCWLYGVDYFLARNFISSPPIETQTLPPNGIFLRWNVASSPIKTKNDQKTLTTPGSAPDGSTPSVRMPQSHRTRRRQRRNPRICERREEWKRRGREEGDGAALWEIIDVFNNGNPAMIIKSDPNEALHSYVLPQNRQLISPQRLDFR